MDVDTVLLLVVVPVDVVAVAEVVLELTVVVVVRVVPLLTVEVVDEVHEPHSTGQSA